MIRKYVLPVLAVVGATFAIYSVAQGSRPVPVAGPEAEPAQAPYSAYVAGAGLVESSSQNIALGSPVARLVLEVLVKPGAELKAGDPLFRLDDRDLRAELETRRAHADAAKARLARLAAGPRAEELPPAEGRVAEARASLDDLADQLKMWESLPDKRAVSAEALARRRYAVQAAAARLATAQSQLALLQAGAWKPDLDVARAELATAEAQVRATETEIGRYTVRAPVDGTVLQVNIRAGEFAQAGALATPLVLFGATARLHVRVDIDENEAWRFRPDSKAVAFVRGNRELKTTLDFVRVEPFVIPKRSLTGESTERVDTRVLQAVYSFDRGALPVYVGQLMDVFIEAPARAGGRP